MQSIDSLGLFWLPDHDGDQLSGRLKFDPAGGDINLSLVGTFDNAVADGGEPTVRIFGWLGSNPVTLESCYSGGSTFGSPGVAQSSYHANRMFLGHHVESELQEFQSAETTFSYADTWVGHSGIKVENNYWRNQSEPTPIYTATYTPTAQDEQPFTRGHIQLGYRWHANGDSIRGVYMRQWPVFTTRYAEPHSLKTITRDVRLLQSLITLCVDTPVHLDKLILTHPDVHRFMLDGSDSGAEQPIELVNSPIPYTAPEARKVRHPYEILLTFEEVGGLPTIARWLEIAPQFQRALNSLMSVKYAEHMFAENRLLNATYGAEAFHRLTQNERYMEPTEFRQLLDAYLENTPEEHHDWLRGKVEFGNDPPLVKRLTKLAARAAPAIRSTIGNKEKWARALSQVRNELTHLNADSPEFDGGDLVFLTNRCTPWSASACSWIVACPSTRSHKKPIRTRFTGTAAAWHSLLSACANN
ncbi:MAG TPA: HEPN domain-containing protein [Propionibacteriaceae bacterium]|nr:HEPN domain-containing protein [Propionibacteriaceae bacterium]